MHLEGPGLGPCLVPGWQDSPRGASLVSSVWTLPMLLLVELVLLCPVFLHEAAPPPHVHLGAQAGWGCATKPLMVPHTVVSFSPCLPGFRDSLQGWGHTPLPSWLLPAGFHHPCFSLFSGHLCHLALFSFSPVSPAGAGLGHVLNNGLCLLASSTQNSLKWIPRLKTNSMSFKPGFSQCVLLGG